MAPRQEYKDSEHSVNFSDLLQRAAAADYRLPPLDPDLVLMQQITGTSPTQDILLESLPRPQWWPT